MADEVKVSGATLIRPARLGLVFDANEENFTLACSLLSAAWGGKFSFMFPRGTPEEVMMRVADLNSLDAIIHLPRESEPAPSGQFSGLHWRTLPGSDPFSPAAGFTYRDGSEETLLSTRWVIEHADVTPFAYKYYQDDFLRNLLLAQYGGFPKEDLFFTRRVKHLYGDYRPQGGGTIAMPPERQSAIELTGYGVEDSGNDPTITFVIVDPNDFSQLMHFWNLRASGERVFAWPAKESERVTLAAKKWLKLQKRRLSNGEHEFGHLVQHVNLVNDDRYEDSLVKFFAEESCETHKLAWISYKHRTHRPTLQTEFEQRFSATGSDSLGHFAAPVSNFFHRKFDSKIASTGIVAVDIRFDTDKNLPAGTTFAVPNIRTVSRYMTHSGNSMEAFRHAAYGGISVGVSSDSEQVYFPAYRSISFFQKLLKQQGWSIDQSDSGVFASHVIQKLGGEDSTVANQPAYRSVLYSASNSPRGLPIARLIQEAKNNRGKWPFFEGETDNYPTRVVYHLLGQEVLRPHLAIKCPTCLNESTIRPSDLNFRFQCDFCGASPAFGLALGLHQKSDWVYQLAGNIAAARLSETLPIMACITVLRSMQGGSNQSSSATVLGLRINSRDLKCEIDIAMFLSDAVNPIVVLGEVKSRRDSITSQDVRNLRAVQERFIKSGIRSVILLATLREKFEQDELLEIQGEFSETEELQTLGGRTCANLPLTLVNSDLSVEYWSEEHPTRWLNGPRFIENFANHSCKKNLGLTGVEPSLNQGFYKCSFEDEGESKGSAQSTSDGGESE
ncbi:hypothetical protein ACGFMK_25230 [Amycolatopsis sp. NPDC049252]|uniref:hypothetical protein n=1 Tax=Amycolatopsis sp. NPDC049252 TaxID=3363933 RepID=UPI0037111E5C